LPERTFTALTKLLVFSNFASVRIDCCAKESYLRCSLGSCGIPVSSDRDMLTLYGLSRVDSLSSGECLGTLLALLPATLSALDTGSVLVSGLRGGRWNGSKMYLERRFLGYIGLQGRRFHPQRWGTVNNRFAMCSMA